MKLRIITTDFAASMKGWMRSKGTMFWSIVFPVMLILIFGAIFSGTDNPNYTLYVQDLDNSTGSIAYIDNLSHISLLTIKIIPPDANISDYIKDNSLTGALVIPKGFNASINQYVLDKNGSVNLSFYYDPSNPGATSVVQNIISSSLQEMNLRLAGGKNVIGMDLVSTITTKFKYIDFFIPGMVGFTIMQLCIYGSIERNTKYRKD